MAAVRHRPIRWALAPLTGLIFVAGVWVAGGLITDTWRLAIASTALWFAAAAIAVLLVARARRGLAAPLITGLVVSATLAGAISRGAASTTGWRTIG